MGREPEARRWSGTLGPPPLGLWTGSTEVSGSAAAAAVFKGTFCRVVRHHELTELDLSVSVVDKLFDFSFSQSAGCFVR